MKAITFQTVKLVRRSNDSYINCGSCNSALSVIPIFWGMYIVSLSYSKYNYKRHADDKQINASGIGNKVNSMCQKHLIASAMRLQACVASRNDDSIWTVRKVK